MQLEEKKSERSDSSVDESSDVRYAHGFAELVAFIEDKLADKEEQAPVFKLSNLVQLYRERLVQLGVSSPYVHATRLKDRIAANFPELQAFDGGNGILFMSNRDVGMALRQACEYDADGNAYILTQAARIVRKEFLIQQSNSVASCQKTVKLRLS